MCFPIAARRSISTCFAVLLLGASPATASADATVAADVEELRALVRLQVAPFAAESFDADDVGIRFVGKGAVARAPSPDDTRLDPGQASPPEDTVLVCIGWRTTRELRPEFARFLVAFHVAMLGPCDRSWRAFNPATQNEFEIVVPPEVLEAIHTRQEQNGDTRAFKGRVGDSEGDAPEGTITPTRGPRARKQDEPGLALQPGPFEAVVPAAFHNIPPALFQRFAPSSGLLLRRVSVHAVVPVSFSDGVDNRALLTPTTSWPWRTISDLGGCTGTLVGPRHLVTAGHCLYNRTTQAWSLNITVTPGLDRGNAPYGSSTLPPGPGETGWYFTPSNWRAANPAGGTGQYDLGILVLPDRIGDVTGWMGYVTRPGSDLDAAVNYNRGYPWCESETGGSPQNAERIDEPNNTSQASDGTVPAGIGSCSIDGLYGDINDCDLGEFSKSDGTWSRRVRHSCDGGAAMSGAALYHYFPVFPNAVVHAVHTTSLKCRLTTETPCTASDDRPLEATRLTVEYRDWISYFRALFP